MRILILQPRAIGDVLCTTPVINYLKQTIPNAAIDFLVDPIPHSLVLSHPMLNEALVYDRTARWEEMRRVRSRNYDAVLDFMNNPATTRLTAFSRAKWRVGFDRNLRSLFYNVRVPVPEEPEYVPLRKIRMVDAWLRRIGVSSQKPMITRPILYLTPADESYAQEWIKQEKLEGQQFAIIMPVHKHPICRWRAEGFRNVALNLARSGKCKIYLAWGPGEENLVREIRQGHEHELGIRPPDDLRKFGAILKRSAFLLANNSGAMHLAVSVGTPTVTIYGPTRAVDWNPGTERDIALSALDVACLGCRLKKCPVGHLCMMHLEEDQVLKACLKFLDGGRLINAPVPPHVPAPV